VKLLLTSAGLRNQTLRQALRDLAGRVYVGVSAGSMIFSRHLDEHSAGVSAAIRPASSPKAGGGFTPKRFMGYSPTGRWPRA
jgi:peptidase E